MRGWPRSSTATVSGVRAVISFAKSADKATAGNHYVDRFQLLHRSHPSVRVHTPTFIRPGRKCTLYTRAPKCVTVEGFGNRP